MSDKDATLAERADIALRTGESGERRVKWMQLVELDPVAARDFVEALKATAIERGLELNIQDDILRDELVVRWRPDRSARR